MDLPAALNAFPPVELAFAYGSGVFTQRGYESSSKPGAKAPMVDLVFSVADPLAWHQRNIAANAEHYSILRRFGASLVTRVQQTGGGKIYYNTLVPLPAQARGAPGQTMKYGVISTADLIDDLLHWRHLYVAGRMHKPVRILSCSQPRILSAARENLRHALRAALLMLPARFTATQLYTAVAGLSYTGDFRMVLGENPDKVANIVAGSLPHFHSLYSPLLTASFPTVEAVASSIRPPPPSSFSSSFSSASGSDGSDSATELTSPSPHLPPLAHDPALVDVTSLCYEQDTSPEARLALGLGLPYRLQKRMASAWGREVTGEGAGGLTLLVRQLRDRLGLPSRQPRVSVTVSPSARSDTASAAVATTVGAAESISIETHGSVTTIRSRASGAKARVLRARGQIAERLRQLAASTANPIGDSAGNRPYRLARAIRLAEKGRELMRRLRQQRLQWLVARREKFLARREKASKLLSSVRDRAAASATSNSFRTDDIAELQSDKHRSVEFADAEIRNILEVEAAEEEAGGVSEVDADAEAAGVSSAVVADGANAAPQLVLGSGLTVPLQPPGHTLAYTQAVGDERIVRFWSAMVEKASSASAAAPIATSAASTDLNGTSPSVDGTATSSASSGSSAAKPGNFTPPPTWDVAGASSPYLGPAIAHIVGSTARWQSLKGILTAGPSKAALYGAAKLQKMAGGMAKRLLRQ